MIGYVRAHRLARSGSKEAVQLRANEQVVNILQNNQFLYQVSKPRREPYSLNCVRPEFRNTFRSILFEAYVLSRARELKTEFSFRDFLELKPDAFHRIVRRLKRKGKVIANPERTIPRYYLLTERLPDYLSVSESNIVRQLYDNRKGREESCDKGEESGVVG